MEMKSEKNSKIKDVWKRTLFYTGVVTIIVGIAMIYIPAAVIVGGLFIAGTAVS